MKTLSRDLHFQNWLNCLPSPLCLTCVHHLHLINARRQKPLSVLFPIFIRIETLKEMFVGENVSLNLCLMSVSFYYCFYLLWSFMALRFTYPPFFDFSFLPRRAKLGATDISLAGT